MNDTHEFHMGADILDDWDRANHGTRQEFKTSFNKHANTIIVRAQEAIENGRVNDASGFLVIDQDDFPETG